MPKRVFVASFVLVALVSGLAFGDGATPVEGIPVEGIAVPVGLPVQLDGSITAAEWEGAARRALDGDGSELLVAQRDGTLLLALASPRPWPAGASLWIGFQKGLGFQKDRPEHPGLFDQDAVHLDFEPREHNRPHLIATHHGAQGPVRIEEGVAIRAAVDRGRSAVEIAIDLKRLGIEGDDAGTLRMVLLWNLGRQLGRIVWPSAVSLQPTAQGKPEGLASSEGWAKLIGWKGTGGPGAFPQTRWAAWHAEDVEIAKRGQKAHAMAHQIAGSSNYAKLDDAILEQIEGNLRWIGEREPLTPYDVLILAQTYRFLNRTAEALRFLHALDSHPDWRGSARLLYELARTEEAAGRFEDAATTWRKVKAKSAPGLAAQYESMAKRAEGKARAWKSEQEARAKARAREDLPVVRLRTTRGDVFIQLFRDDVPKGVKHFLDLVERKDGETRFYEGTRFHRVLGNYLVQGGDPISRRDVDAAGSGSGPTSVEVEKNQAHGFWRGAVAFARGPALENGSQFFILTAARPSLGEQDFTCFGHVIAGMDVVDRIELADELLEVRILEMR